MKKSSFGDERKVGENIILYYLVSLCKSAPDESFHFFLSQPLKLLFCKRKPSKTL